VQRHTERERDRQRQTEREREIDCMQYRLMPFSIHLQHVYQQALTCHTQTEFDFTHGGWVGLGWIGFIDALRKTQLTFACFVFALSLLKTLDLGTTGHVLLLLANVLLFLLMLLLHLALAC
jgi:hypothetical protein